MIRRVFCRLEGIGKEAVVVYSVVCLLSWYSLQAHQKHICLGALQRHDLSTESTICLRCYWGDSDWRHIPRFKEFLRNKAWNAISIHPLDVLLFLRSKCVSVLHFGNIVFKSGTWVDTAHWYWGPARLPARATHGLFGVSSFLFSYYLWHKPRLQPVSRAY
jgi:hypothetical protein